MLCLRFRPLLVQEEPMGKVVSMQVIYETETDRGTEAKSVTLTAMRKYCRAERVADLLEDLTLVCEDVQAGRDRQRRRAGALPSG
jgi:hypothetical protein